MCPREIEIRKMEKNGRYRHQCVQEKQKVGKWRKMVGIDTNVCKRKRK